MASNHKRTVMSIIVITAGLLAGGVVTYINSRHVSRVASPESGHKQVHKTTQSAKKKTEPPKLASGLPPTPPAATIPPPVTTPLPMLPAKILDLTSWRLDTPVDTPHTGTPDDIRQPELSTFANTNFFYANSQNDGVVFSAHADGTTTAHSSYPRSELREMSPDGKKLASWSTTSGSHTMTVRAAITHLPDVKKELVAGQVHDSKDDVIMIRLEGTHLFVEGGGKNLGDLDTQYNLGTVFTYKIVAEHSVINVYYNDELKVSYPKSGSEYYFKAGCYTQTNLTKGDTPSSYGEVVIYQLNVSHSS